MLNLAGYQEIDQIYAGTRTLVYRALQTTTEQLVIIKVLRNPHPNFKELVQFRNQYIITRNLEHPNIVQPLALERHNNGYALVMLDQGAISLPNYWQQSEQSLAEFLTIAIQLAEALHYLGQQRIIHKDIKPPNILIHPETGQVQLIDFSISSLLPKEQQQLINPKGLEGTLAYISPEQTGRMNRGIDYRTDFYSLGVTLYKLLTGILPFHSNEPMDLLHRHIAQIPLTLHDFLDVQGNPYPPVISKIILKLMAKNAEDRYQSALGLRHDLERCLQKLDTTGVIETFELGERDICDRFLIPEKLYGRETEVQTLLAVFDRVANPPQFPLGKGERGGELLLVAGFSGIGKTALINEVHKPIVEKRGYFIKGKFDQFNRNIPFSAFVQAFRSLMGQLLGESDLVLATWKEKILDAVGESGQVILEVIPELERIIGGQPTVPELSGSAAQNRFNLLFSKFVQVFTTKDHPLVIFLDDLQWVDSASLNLLRLLLNESEAGYLLVLGAYRDNEVFPAHPLILALDEFRQQKAVINTLTLAPLAEVDINHLVADTLLCSAEIATPLSKLVYQKTQGNPFFTTQFLLGLHAESHIVFTPPQSPLTKDRNQGGWLTKGGWQCNLTQVRQLALTDDVVEFMVGRLQKLPEATQEVLKIAACIGSQFDLTTLAVVCEQSQEEVATDLWQALQEGLVIPENETYKFFQGGDCEIETASDITVGYRFLHDRVQQAAYSLIPNHKKATTHYHIGQLLLQRISPSTQEERIFELVGQLNYGTSLITQQTQRDELAYFNLIACRRAKAATAYEAGREYAKTGLLLLGEMAWQRVYETSLELHELATEFAYLTGQVNQMNALVENVINKANNHLDTVKTLQIKIYYYTAQQDFLSAIELARSLLQKLEIYLPNKPSFEDVRQEFSKIKKLTKKFSLDEIAELPALRDSKKLAVASTLITIGTPAISTNPNLFWFIILTLVKLSLEHGNSPYSAYGYISYGILVNLLEQDINEFYQLGQLSVKVLDRFEVNTTKSRVFEVVGAYTTHIKFHLRETFKFLAEAYISGLESGDFEYAGYSLFTKCQNNYFAGQLLTNLQQEIIKSNQAITSINNKVALGVNQIYAQAVAKLLGQLDTPSRQEGYSLDFEEIYRSLAEANNRFGLHHFYLNQAILQYLFPENNQALVFSKLTEEYLDAATGWFTEYVFIFYDSLIHISCISESDSLENSVISQYLEKVQSNQRKMKVWAFHAPMNFQHKYDLVEAEKSRLLGQKIEAIELYDKAISGAKENKYIQEEALANELAAKFYLDWGKEKIAAIYMQEAYYCYARWGAKAKTDDLEQRYPHLLQLILQRTTQNLNSLETLSLISSQISVHASTKSSNYDSTSINTSLDFAAVLKTSQAISRIIKLDELLRQLTQTILQQSGGDRCALILPNSNGNWFVEAIATTDTTNLCSEPLEGHLDFPTKLIQYVKNTQTALVMDNLDTDLPIIDDYLSQQQPKSVLCLPILNQSQLIGILYLSNQSTSGVFTKDRLLILNFLCTQAAISLKNAQLYAELKLSEARATAVFQQAAVGFVESDMRTGKLTLVNPCFCQMTGYTTAELMEITVAELTHPDDFPASVQAIQQLYSGQIESFTLEKRYIRKDKSCFWAETTVYLVELQEEQSSNCLAIIQDISEKKRLEAERQEAETVLQNLVLGTAATTGQDFFSALVTHIATALSVSYVMVTEKVDETLRTLAFWSNGVLQPTYNYNLAHTPCELVLRNGEWYGECSMQELFPEDVDLVELGVESYFGTALYNTEGAVIGHLCILNTETIQDLKQAEYLLRIFAARAAAELERKRAMTSLEHLNRALEIKVEEQSEALAMTQAAVDRSSLS
ncbi:MAG: AAA family ATPase [Symploca sp. SIO2G7]|nr:AAA family ATPase [Symploca sp. SIO2G7]